MKISLNNVLLVLFLFFSVKIVSAISIEQAQENLMLGRYSIAEYQFKVLWDNGNMSQECLRGYLQSLNGLKKFESSLSFVKDYEDDVDDTLLLRNIGYAKFMKGFYRQSYYFYDKALQEDNDSKLDRLGRAWAAYYLGRYSESYADMKVAYRDDDSQEKVTSLALVNSSWKKNYLEFYYNHGDNKDNISIFANRSIGNSNLELRYSNNDSNGSKREMYTALCQLNWYHQNSTISYFNVSGDYDKLYPGYGFAISNEDNVIYKESVLRWNTQYGYSHLESLSSHQSRFDIGYFDSGIYASVGCSYLYLDYITKGFDRHHWLGHFEVSYEPISYVKVIYKYDYGKVNFSYDKLHYFYDDNDISWGIQTFGVDFKYSRAIIYYRMQLKDEDKIENGGGIGISF